MVYLKNLFAFFKRRCILSFIPKELERGGVAQLVEQRTENPCVTGSIPVLATIFLYFCRMGTRRPAFLFPLFGAE